MAKAREALKSRRKELGHTQQSFADLLGVPCTTYRDWEQGVTTPRPGHRPRLARHLQVPVVELGRWIDGDDRERAPAGFEVKGWLWHFVELEQGAGQLWVFEPVVVPGLLQTAGYATEVEHCGPAQLSATEVSRYVGARLARQEVLDRQPDPLRLSAIIDESILYRMAGDATVMAQQLGHLISLAQRPTVDLRVLPFAAGEFSPAFGSFTVLAARGSDQPYMAHVKDRTGAHYLDRPAEVAAHMELFSHLVDVALSPSESVDLITSVSRERYE